MKKIVLTFGLISGAILASLSAVLMPLCLNGTIPSENMELVGYTAMEKEMARFKELYKNPLFNVGITFLEVFPVGLIVTLVSAAILRKKQTPDAHAPVTAAA